MYALIIRSVFSVNSVVKNLLASMAAISPIPAGQSRNDYAAVRSLILAAFVSIRRRFSSFPPIFVSQNSQYGACPRHSRRSLRRQFSQFRQP